MLIPYSATQGYSLLRSRLTDAALVDLDKIMRAVAGEPAAVQREAMMDLLPELGSQYASATGTVSAVFSGELMELQGVKRPVAPEVLALPPKQSWFALAGFGMSDRVLERGGMVLAYSLLAGGLTKRLTEFAADTMIGNASIQTVSASAQRVPKPGCCGFCGMLASRFAGYSSEKAAGQVVGRGVPVGKGRGRGMKGRGMGIRPRGSRAIGEDFHDHCRCEVVAITEGNYAQLQADAGRYFEAYRDAYDKADKGLVRVETTYKIGPGDYKTKYSWATNEGEPVSSKGRASMIASAMRDELNVK